MTRDDVGAVTVGMDRARTTILIVDDHALFREGLREILEHEDDLVVVGEAGTSEQAVALATAERPDVVVLDVGIPGEPAAVTAAAILASVPHCRILVLSMYDDPAVVRELLAIGVRGYLLKTVTGQEVVVAVRGVCGDDERIVLAISRESLTQTNASGPRLLSNRELEVLSLVAQGMSNHQVAHRLRITEGTVKRHLRNTFAKLGARSRIDAVNKAVLASLIVPPWT